MRCATVLLLALLAPVAEVGAESARELLDRSKAVNDAREPGDVAQRMRMVLVDSQGGERVRELETRIKKVGENARKSLLVFLAPREVKGVGFLSFSHPDREDDQWLYLPALQRTRRITARGRTRSFQGSDFTYRDLELFDEVPSWTEEDATSSLVGEETVDGIECAVIALEPKGEDVPYGKIVVWLDTADSVLRRMDLYGADANEVQKRLVLSEYRTVGEVPTPHVMEMTNLPKETKTRLEISEVRYDQGLSEDLFTERQLERGKVD